MSFERRHTPLIILTLVALLVLVSGLWVADHGRGAAIRKQSGPA